MRFLLPPPCMRSPDDAKSSPGENMGTLVVSNVRGRTVRGKGSVVEMLPTIALFSLEP